ncbi:hypothetical protein Z043_106298 [Scleropages formosus]|uniref:Histone H2A/H2B/H3 domain-containing protein n=1 Tax=Scleropages formosus TaxID=113540 RepID=A0A0P7VGF3_SCLFO|nr:hypothetical protein Z043_106298 [Scleropages formosus]
MKASGVKMTKTTRLGCPERRRTRAYSICIYRLQKGLNVECRPVSIPARTSALVLYNVGLEAARLSKFNKRGAITTEEVCLAMELLHPKKRSSREGA